MVTRVRKTASREKAKRGPSTELSETSFRTIGPFTTERQFPAALHPVRALHIRRNERKWVNGTTLHYYFFNRNSDGRNSDGTTGSWIGPAAQKAVVRKAFQAWKDAGIGLEFREVTNREDAELRIGFMADEESWSYVGRDAIDVAKDADERTMNFAGDLTTPHGWQSALQQIGRALGFGELGQWPSVKSTSDDPLPAPVIALAQRSYPPMTAMPEAELLPGRSHLLALAPGEQTSFRIRPLVTRPYAIQIFGACDAVMVLFEELNGLALYEEMDGETEFLAGCDDSGTDRNAIIRTRLHRDREYVLRIRVYFRNTSHATAVLVW